MNNFPYAYEPLKRVEGGYANDAADPGGETYAGISRVYNPTWEGWAILDAIPNKRLNQKFPQLDNAVAVYYYQEKWLPHRLDEITDRDIAAAALDTIVQHGKGPVLIQKALQRVGKAISIDGKLGPDTFRSLNATPAKIYLPALYEVRKAYYEGLVAADPRLSKFLPGWLSRIDKWKGIGGGILGLTAVCAAAWMYLKNRRII